jgi:hypothetical protein
MPAVMLAEFMDLGVAVMATRDTIIRAGGLDLLVFQTTVFQTLFLEPGLEKATAAAAAIIIGFVGGHVDEIFLTDHGFHDEPQILGNGVAVAFADDLAGILDRELDFQVLVPIGIDLEFAFTNPFGIIFINIFNFKLMFDFEFFQSGPDCECYVPSLGIEERFTPQRMGLIR